MSRTINESNDSNVFLKSEDEFANVPGLGGTPFKETPMPDQEKKKPQVSKNDLIYGVLPEDEGKIKEVNNLHLSQK